MSVAARPTTGVLATMTGYAEGVIDGSIATGRLVRLAAERHKRDLNLASLRGLWFDEDEAERAVAFIANLRHSKGEWGPRGKRPGQPFVLEPWQVFIVGSVFGWMREGEDGEPVRRFSGAHVELARKNGKTTLAAAIGLYMLLADDEPGAEIYSAATKRDQAKLCWTEARNMVRSTPALASRVTVSDAKSNLSYAPLNAKFEAMGRDADTADGPNPHCGIVDELHAHPNRDMVDVIETGMGARRQPLMLLITTAGYNQTGIWNEKRSYAVQVLEQNVIEDGLFAYVATLDDGDDWRDEATWPKGNPNLGISVKWESLRKEFREAVASPEKQPAFLTKRLNVSTNAASRWIDVVTEWDPCMVEPVVNAGDTGFVATDMASTIDLSAAAAVFLRSDGSIDVLWRFWRPRETIEEAEKRDHVPYRLWAEQGWITLVEGSMTDPAAIADDILDWSSSWNVPEYPFDRWNASSVAARYEAAGATPVAMAQGHVTYSEPCHRLKGLLRSRKARFGKNPVSRWMAGQVMVELGANDALRPWKPKGSGIRDDGITTLLMALGRAIVYQQGDGGESVYESRGLRSF